MTLFNFIRYQLLDIATSATECRLTLYMRFVTQVTKAQDDCKQHNDATVCEYLLLPEQSVITSPQILMVQFAKVS